MKNRIDYILLGLLWLLAATLATCFWFNTAFGFNIFSAQHWQYLAYMQATHQSVKPLFYISLTVSILLTVGGLYMLLRPRLRRIKLPIFSRKKRGNTAPNPNHNQPTTPAQNPDASGITITTAPVVHTAPMPQPAAQLPVAQPDTTQGAPSPARPPRLTLPTNNRVPAQPQDTPSKEISPFVQNTAPNPEKYFEEIKQIFESTGYVSKGHPKIGNVRTVIVAIGVDEVLWMGAVGVKTTDMRTAIDRLSQVFSDTLDDIEIGVNGFVINAPDAATSEFQDILMFDSVDALREYMSAHPNPPITPDDQGNFDAYSAYISTVVDYIGKI